MKGFLTDWILHRLFEWSIDNRYIGEGAALLTLQCPQIWRGNDAKNIGAILVFPDFSFLLFFIAIKTIIIRDSRYVFVPRSNPWNGFYESHMQHDRDIIYRLLIFTEDIIIFSDINVRYFFDTRTVRIKNESCKNDRAVDFFQREEDVDCNFESRLSKIS